MRRDRDAMVGMGREEKRTVVAPVFFLGFPGLELSVGRGRRKRRKGRGVAFYSHVIGTCSFNEKIGWVNGRQSVEVGGVLCSGLGPGL